MMRKIEETSADSVPDANKDLVLSCPSLDAYSEGGKNHSDHDYENVNESNYTPRLGVQR